MEFKWRCSKAAMHGHSHELFDRWPSRRLGLLSAMVLGLGSRV